MPNIYDLAQRFRNAVLRQDAAAARALLRAYGTAGAAIRREWDALLAKMDAARARGESITPAWLLQQERYRLLLAQTEAEITAFARQAGEMIAAEQQRAERLAITHTEALWAASAKGLTVAPEFNRLPRGALESAVAFQQPASPLSLLLSRLPGHARQEIQDALIEGVALGRGARAIARNLELALAGNRARALRIARTETLRSYREAGHQAALANREFLSGWVWLSALNGRCCAACVALHGTFHPLEERMATHVNCRCTRLDVLAGQPSPVTETGVDWFAAQPASLQAEILDSPKALAAYRGGELSLQEFVGRRESVAWGPSYYQLSLPRARAGEGAFPGTGAPPIAAPSLPASLPPRAAPPLARPPVPNVRIVGEEEGVKAAIRAALGREIDPARLAAAAGAMEGSSVEIRLVGSQRVEVSVTHPHVLNQIRTFARDGKNLTLYNNLFVKRQGAPPGIAAEMLWQQVVHAEELGIAEIRTDAAGDANSPYFNGYYTWPRLGYNATLETKERRALPAGLKGARTVRDLMATPDGRAWWKARGNGREMVFDLRPGAVSKEILAQYLIQKRGTK